MYLFREKKMCTIGALLKKLTSSLLFLVEGNNLPLSPLSRCSGAGSLRRSCITGARVNLPGLPGPSVDAASRRQLAAARYKIVDPPGPPVYAIRGDSLRRLITK